MKNKFFVKERLNALLQRAKNVRGLINKLRTSYIIVWRGQKAQVRAVNLAYFDKTAKESERIVLFYSKRSFKTTQEAYWLKRSTLLKWQKLYGEFGINGRRCLKWGRISQRVFAYKGQETIFNQRQEVKAFIANYRKNHGNIHKKIKREFYPFELSGYKAITAAKLKTAPTII